MTPASISGHHHLSGDGDLDLDTGLDVDNDLLDDLGRGVEAVWGGLLSVKQPLDIRLCWRADIVGTGEARTR